MTKAHMNRQSFEVSILLDVAMTQWVTYPQHLETI